MMMQLLWCVHVAGPDEVLAAKDYEEARREADELNYMIAPHCGVVRHEFDPIIRAAPMIWPWCAESWAKDLIRHMGSRVEYAARFNQPIWEREAEKGGFTRAETTKALSAVLAERVRQVSEEGWTPEHDDEHSNMDLSYAAACYAGPVWKDEKSKADGLPPIGWPWARNWWKPKDRRRDLVRAGALIVAEIERLDRATLAAQAAAKQADQ